MKEIWTRLEEAVRAEMEALRTDTEDEFHHVAEDIQSLSERVKTSTNLTVGAVDHVIALLNDIRTKLVALDSASPTVGDANTKAKK